MRSRRQNVSDAVSVLGMDPWKDDRVRDFVAINTIQRLRAYHLPTSAPMPVMDEVNAARARNLILLPRADPDYRPCLGEQPPSRARERQERRERRQRQKEEADGNCQSGNSPEYSSTSAPTSSSSGDCSDVDGETALKNDATSSVTNRSFHIDPATLTKQAGPRSPAAFCATATAAPSAQCAIDRARSVFFGASSFTSSTSPRRLVNSPHVPLTPSMESTTTVACWSGMHAPRSPKEASASITTSPVLYDSRTAQCRSGREVTAVATEDGSATSLPPAPPASSTVRSLGMELDAYREANSTPLRPPPLMRYTGVSAQLEVRETMQTTASAGVDSSGWDESPNDSALLVPHEAAKPEADAPYESTPAKATATAPPSATEPSPISLEATPTAIRPPSPRLAVARRNAVTTPSQSHDCSSSDRSADIKHTCDVCEAIVQYYQSMLTKGVVLDRYNHKDLAFVWWVLGRNMDVAALENRGPMRREALMITLRNFYYTLLSAEEAKAKAAAAEVEKSHTEGEGLGGMSGAATSASAGGRASLTGSADTTATGGRQGVTEDTEEHWSRASRKATGSSSNAEDTLADASVAIRLSRPRSRDTHADRASAAAAASIGHTDSSGGAGTGIFTMAPKRSRRGKSLFSSHSGEEQHDAEHPVEEDGVIGVNEADGQESMLATPMRGRTSVPSPSKKVLNKEIAAPEDRFRSASDDARGRSSSAVGEGLAAALRKEHADETATSAAPVGVDDALGNEVDTLRVQAEGDTSSLASSANASRAGSVAQGSSAKIPRRHRRAAERDKAVEETWFSTRTGRRAAAIKATTQLELQGSADAMAYRKLMEAEPYADTPRAAKAAAVRRLKKEASAIATAKDLDAVAVSATPTVPASSSAASKVPRKKCTASKRARNPSHENFPDEGPRSPGSGSSVASDAELTKEEEKGRNAEAPHTVLRGSASKSKSRVTAPAKAPTTANACPSPGKATAPPSEATTTDAATGSTATALKKGGRGEEHRGRPRGSCKLPRISSLATEDHVISGLASVARSSQRRRDVEPSTAALTGTLSETAACDRRTDAVGIRIASPSSCAPSKAGEGANSLGHPVCEVPLHLTPHERVVRARIQQRMGVPLPAPPPRSSAGLISDTSLDAPQATVYSSYTFLLSSFRTAASAQNSHDNSDHEWRAITAPVLWYGQVISPVAADESRTNVGSGASSRRLAREKTIAAACSEDVVLNGSAPSLATAIATAAVVPTRQRGRKRRIEGGVDPSLRGNVLWHDQVALERLVEGRLAQSAEPGQAAMSRVVESGQAKCGASVIEILQVKEEHRGSSEEAEKTAGEAHVKTEVAVADLDVVSPVPPAGPSLTREAAASLNTAGPTGKDAAAPTEEALAPEQHRCDSAQRAPMPQASVFGDLPYAQQCLLVWSAAGLLERHVHQRQMAELRRKRVLERCGRMATRRMAASAAAVVQDRITNGGVHGIAQNAAAQLAEELRRGIGDSISSMSAEESDASEEERAVEKRVRSSALGRSRGMSRKVEADDHLHCLGQVSDQSATSRSSSANSSSASSEERLRNAMRPLPRRAYDYWASYRCASDNG
ncbi:hypothetical protein GH5_05241 [Leishmania sp. Ghana 2012 LV757]|uniref:hypothetical protein n=1 Tax=Leishmania sp. Ghana 2012 LV757 TaxID=2803181 RepID=UPI001B40DD3E|nr:hypothetical protein GH5_05241 [Leishmania sp. Ghana 2012 LV757]